MRLERLADAGMEVDPPEVVDLHAAAVVEVLLAALRIAEAEPSDEKLFEVVTDRCRRHDLSLSPLIADSGRSLSCRCERPRHAPARGRDYEIDNVRRTYARREAGRGHFDCRFREHSTPGVEETDGRAAVFQMQPPLSTWPTLLVPEVAPRAKRASAAWRNPLTFPFAASCSRSRTAALARPVRRHLRTARRVRLRSGGLTSRRSLVRTRHRPPGNPLETAGFLLPGVAGRGVRIGFRYQTGTTTPDSEDDDLSQKAPTRSGVAPRTRRDTSGGGMIFPRRRGCSTAKSPGS